MQNKVNETEEPISIEEQIRNVIGNIIPLTENRFYISRTQKSIDNNDNTFAKPCSFCDKKASLISYERLADGRILCKKCSKSKVEDEEQFREVLKECIKKMELWFSIKMPTDVTIEVTKKMNEKFSFPLCSRLFGIAYVINGKKFLDIESGTPLLSCIATLVHELTHIWQFDVRSINDNNRMQYEGMAAWAEIAYMYMLGERSYAKFLFKRYIDGGDQTYCYFLAKNFLDYGFPKNYIMLDKSPFTEF